MPKRGISSDDGNMKLNTYYESYGNMRGATAKSACCDASSSLSRHHVVRKSPRRGNLQGSAEVRSKPGLCQLNTIRPAQLLREIGCWAPKHALALASRREGRNEASRSLGALATSGKRTRPTALEKAFGGLRAWRRRKTSADTPQITVGQSRITLPPEKKEPRQKEIGDHNRSATL